MTGSFETTPTPTVVEPNPSRLDLVMGILSVLLVGGFFIDLWAHSHGRVDDSFFTPWHGLLYASAGLFGGVLLGIALRSRRNGARPSESLPPGYGLSLIGAGVFLASGLADLLPRLRRCLEAPRTPTAPAPSTGSRTSTSGWTSWR